MNYKIAGFDIPHVDQEDKLRRILGSALKSKLGKDVTESYENNLMYWSTEHFDLNKVKIFIDSSHEEQAQILHLCNQALLEEAYLIEKAGVGYMSKMVLLAETTEERMLYALFSADEVTHLAQISSFLPSEIVATNNPFLQLLAEVAETSDKAVLIFVLQVILEGWGLTHYRNLAKNCQRAQLKAILQSFLEDESRHHATGVRLCEQMSIENQATQKTIFEILASFLQMVQVGPQGVVAAVEQVKGGLSRQQKITIFQELGAEYHSSSRLNLLRSLMIYPQTRTIVQQLDEQNAFKPFSPEQCVIV
ncbi:MAG: ferritin-like domain-containing protein [Calothrix sp. C42_A2020_038]|nr:ferritin-like domain-containing protein [Calothrix sp. C42_A2020_038]